MKAFPVLRVACALTLGAAVIVACSHKGGTPGAAAASGAASGAAVSNGAAVSLVAYSGNDRVLSTNAASRTVTVNLVAGQGASANGFNFNGYANGDMHIQVPTGWRVKVSMVDQSQTPHSALIVPWNQRQGGMLQPAFTGSAPADFRSGMEQGDDPLTFTFTAGKAGQYAIVCGVPGHIDAGMWDAFDVVDSLAAPRVLVAK